MSLRILRSGRGRKLGRNIVSAIYGEQNGTENLVTERDQDELDGEETESTVGTGRALGIRES